jgi:hypothetical protein
VVPVVGRVRICAVIALCALVSACGGDPGPAPEVAEGAAPGGQHAVSLPDYPAESVGDGDEWPRACELMTRDEVQAVLPQATALELKGSGGGFDYQVVGQGSSYYAPTASSRYGQSRHIDIPEQSCEAQMRLPSDDEDDGAFATVEVKVDMVGSPDTVRYFWSEPTEPKPMADQFGAEECVEQGNDDPETQNVDIFRCRKGRMSIEVTGVLTVDEDEEHMRLAGQQANTPLPQVYDWYRTRVVPQLVGVAARRMP